MKPDRSPIRLTRRGFLRTSARQAAVLGLAGSAAMSAARPA